MTHEHPAPRLTPAAASRSLSGVLDASPARGRTLGSSSSTHWCAVGDVVLVVGALGAARLPNSLIVGSSVLPMARDEPTVGDGAIRFSDQTIRVTRWWDARIRVLTPSRESLAAGIDRLERLVSGIGENELTEALLCGDPDTVVEAARSHLGLGPGLTPLGDDVLVGAFVAFGALHPNAEGELRRWRETVWSKLRLVAEQNTTSFSAALLRHALKGETLPEVEELVQGVAGHRDLDTAVARLVEVGNTSGHGLARGVLVGATAAQEWTRR